MLFTFFVSNLILAVDVATGLLKRYWLPPDTTGANLLIGVDVDNLRGNKIMGTLQFFKESGCGEEGAGKFLKVWAIRVRTME